MPVTRVKGVKYTSTTTAVSASRTTQVVVVVKPVS